jgi:hypothetical protein
MKPRHIVLLTVAGYLAVLMTGNLLVREGTGVSDAGQWLTQLVGTAVPMVRSVMAIPGGNESIAFYFAWFWVFAPLGAWAGWLYRKRVPDSFGGARRSDLKLAGTVLVVTLGLAVALVWPVAPGSRAWRDRTLVASFLSSFSYTSAALAMICCAGATARMLLVRIRTGSPEEPMEPRNSSEVR